jgi:hypothetical protein
MDYRAGFQKIKTKLPVAFFLFGYGEWYKNADMVYLDSTFVTQCDTTVIKNQKSVFNRSRFDTDTFDKSFRYHVGSN